MEHVKLIMIKYFATFVLLYLVLGIAYGLTTSQIFFVSLISLALYFLGDLFILDQTNNFIATFSDVVINFIVIYLLLDVVGFAGDRLIAAFISSIVLGFYEIFFHLYVTEEFSYEHEPISIGRYDYLMELSEEFEPFIDDEEDDYY
ncbi:DUF2512 family protein [Amphibacillus indicireducens]|uniref:YndM family protein n=1 Tax=Amphibacillus indicireducens TaxID=1076330 RepID=A0ABP7VNW0_9BACI